MNIFTPVCLSYQLFSLSQRCFVGWLSEHQYFIFCVENILVRNVVTKKIVDCQSVISHHLGLSGRKHSFLGLVFEHQPYVQGVCWSFPHEKLRSHFAVPSCIPMVSHGNLNFKRNSMMEIGFDGSKVCDFIWATIRFDTLLTFFETIWSYLAYLFSTCKCDSETVYGSVCSLFYYPSGFWPVTVWSVLRWRVQMNPIRRLKSRWRMYILYPLPISLIMSREIFFSPHHLLAVISSLSLFPVWRGIYSRLIFSSPSDVSDYESFSWSGTLYFVLHSITRRLCVMGLIVSINRLVRFG